MKVTKVKFRVLAQEMAICRAAPGVAVTVPEDPELWSLSRTPEETSLVCSAKLAPRGFIVEAGWRAFRVQGTLDFSLVGVLAGLTGALAQAGISVFALSTFDTDYLLVRARDLEKAMAVLSSAGYSQ